MGRLLLRRWLSLLGGPVYTVWQTKNGQYAWVGNDQGAFLLSATGTKLFAYPGNSKELPVISVVAQDDLSVVYICTREGDIRCVKLENSVGQFSQTTLPKRIYHSNSPDIHSMISVRDAELLIIGYLSAGLAVINPENEQPLWCQHPSSGNATDADTWIVASDSDGNSLYAGSAMPAYNYLVSLNPNNGVEITERRYFEPKTKLTALAVLAGGNGVLAALAEWDDFSYTYTGKLVLYSADLATILWEQAWADMITAVCTDPQEDLAVISAGFNGTLAVLNTMTGTVLAPEISLNALANQISLTQGRYIVAATQNGYVAFLQYQP